MAQFVMTQKNYERLKEELEYLVKVKRPEIIERIAEARSHGDLSENAEYDAAREEQRSNEGKIAEIEYKIKNADIREEVTDTSYVHLNSVVKVYDDDLEEEAAAQTRRTVGEFQGQYQRLVSAFESTAGHVNSELRKIEVMLSQLPRALDQTGAELNELAARLEKKPEEKG